MCLKWCKRYVKYFLLIEWCSHNYDYLHHWKQLIASLLGQYSSKAWKTVPYLNSLKGKFKVDIQFSSSIWSAPGAPWEGSSGTCWLCSTSFCLLSTSLTTDLVILHKENKKKGRQRKQRGRSIFNSLSTSVQSETWIPRRPVWSVGRRKRSQWHQMGLPFHWPPHTTPPQPWATGRTLWDKCKTQQHLLSPWMVRFHIETNLLLYL